MNLSDLELFSFFFVGKWEAVQPTQSFSTYQQKAAAFYFHELLRVVWKSSKAWLSSGGDVHVISHQCLIKGCRPFMDYNILINYLSCIVSSVCTVYLLTSTVFVQLFILYMFALSD